MRKLSCMLFIMVYSIIILNAQSLVGAGLGDGGNAEIGKSYEYRFNLNSLVTDSIKKLKWTVTGGKITSGGSGNLTATVLWNDKKASVEVGGLYEGGKPVYYNFTIKVVDPDQVKPEDFSATISSDFVKKGEKIYIDAYCRSATNFTVRCSGTGFVQSSSSNSKIVGSFSSTGFKSLKVEIVYNNKVVFEMTKSILVIPSEITGSDVVCGSSTEAYTVENLPTGILVDNWTLTEDVGLYIVSGQGTNSITVRASNHGHVLVNATIKYNNKVITLSKSVLANTPRIQYLERWMSDGPIYQGGVFYLRAYPQYSTSICKYVWSVTPAGGVNLSAGDGYEAQVSVYQGASDRFTVQCRIIPACSTTPSVEFAAYSFIAQTRPHYSVVCNNSSKLITISAIEDLMQSKTKINKIENTQSVYELYNIESGKIVKNGLFYETGNVIDVSDLNNSIYVLKIKNGDSVESHKIVIK